MTPAGPGSRSPARATKADSQRQGDEVDAERGPERRAGRDLIQENIGDRIADHPARLSVPRRRCQRPLPVRSSG